MPLNGSGTFTRLYNWVTDRNGGIKIQAARMDAEMDGMATALSTAIMRDGQTTITQNIPFNGKKITGLGDASANTDALNKQSADALYAPINSPAFTGNPTAPTPSPGDNDTSIATTAFVTAAIGGSAGVVSWNSRTGAVTLSAADLASSLYTVTSLASTTTTDILGASTEQVTVTGNNTISSFGTGANRYRVVTFSGAATIVHNATTLNCPGSANIITAAGDRAIVVSDNSSNATIVAYIRATGKALIAPAFSEVTSKPTTLAGYGITDNVALLNSPAFTGAPTAPTAAGGTNNTQIATTAFATAADTVVNNNANTKVGSVSIVGGSPAVGHYLASCTASLVGGVLTLTFTSAADQTGGGGGTCFPRGSMVLMADRTWKEISSVAAGDLVWSPFGPEVVREQYVTRLGSRPLYAMADASLTWSSEHTFLVRRERDTWLWSMDRAQLMREQEEGLIGGLNNWARLMDGKAGRGEYFAHECGWMANVPLRVAPLEHPDLPLFLPLTTNGGMIIVNGYLVGAAVDESKCDYGAINWQGVPYEDPAPA